MKSYVLEQTIRTAQHIIHKIPLEEQRLGQTKLFSVRGIPKEIHCELVEDFEMHSEWVIPEKYDDEVIIFYTHGGGYGMGDLISSRALIAPIAKHCGLKAFSFEYRLSPEYQFPAPLEDCAKAYEYILSKGYEPKNIVILGDSAGGGLLFSVLQYLKQRGYKLPHCGIAISPWTDLTITAESYETMDKADPILSDEVLEKFAEAYIGEESPLNPLVSPVFGKYDESYPPILIQVGNKEVLYDDSVRMKQVLEQSGVNVTMEVYQNMFHIFHIWKIQEAEEAIENIHQFIKKQFYDRKCINEANKKLV